MRVRAHYSLLNEIESGPNATLPALEPLIARWHGTRIRRIDRYIQLCVAGGLNCIAGQPLHPQTGVYLASRVGAVSTSAKTMIQTEQKRSEERRVGEERAARRAPERGANKRQDAKWA